MAKEIETKVLDINVDILQGLLQDLGAVKLQDTLLTVDWFRPVGTKNGADPWYLRIRTNSQGGSEVTWKSQPNFVGISKQVREINLAITDPKSCADLFESIGLERYAHQEKYRISWRLKSWRFDVDHYPGVPPYVEIEGDSEGHLKEAVALLKLENHRAVAEGERTLIQKEYNLNWYDMRF